ncbi:MAG TPA: cysteine desulfurase [Vicinamibacterales bacterium]|jgi:cysteine desulfurase/selenocysteine lyase|nr:cysteine desulfurase [Vicinamibacterales bacterium]
MTVVVSSRPVSVSGVFDVQRVRRDFPILSQKIHGKPLVYLDNAATTQKPQAVIDAMVRSYAQDNANIHRGVHLLSERATQAYELAREKVQHFLNAASSREIVFVRGTTEAINLVAQTYGRAHVGRDDEVLLTEMEHHSNIVPWQLLCEEKGARIKVLPITDEGELRLDLFDDLLTERTRIVALNHVSNSLGTINPIRTIVEKAHSRGIPVLVDGAQAVAHIPVDVQALGADFYAMSGHKLFGPTGVGVLYGKLPLLEAMPPYQGGGDMISSVTFKKTTYNIVPNKFEAGTPNIAGAVGLGAAIDYVRSLDFAAMSAYEDELLAYGTAVLTALPGIRLVGTAKRKTSILSFVMDNVHPHDIGTILDQEGVAIRTGHHCTQPLMERLGVPATARASLALYNNKDEIDALAQALNRVHEIFD